MDKGASLKNLNIVRLGDGGHPLLMLHGWGMSHRSLRPLGELLSSEADIHLIDLPGFGDSPPPEGAWGSGDYASMMIAYMDDNGIETADILGHSFGGRVAIMMASRYPERIRRLVFVAAAGIPPQRSLQKRIRVAWIKIVSRAIKGYDILFKKNLWHQWFVPTFASRDYLEAGAMKDVLVEVVNEDLSDDASHIKSPVLMLWGDKDTETPLSSARRLDEIIDNVSLVVMKGKGHFVFDGVGAHLCAYHIIPFIDEVR